MVVDWASPGDETPGSLRSFGRQLRTHLGGTYRGLDEKMVSLLERLFEVPGIASKNAGVADSAERNG